jgi:hypothetical protein
MHNMNSINTEEKGIDSFEDLLLGQAIGTYIPTDARVDVSTGESFILDITEVQRMLQFTLDSIRSIAIRGEEENKGNDHMPLFIRNNDKMVYVGYIDRYIGVRVLAGYVKDGLKGASLYLKKGNKLFKIKEADSMTIRINL